MHEPPRPPADARIEKLEERNEDLRGVIEEVRDTLEPYDLREEDEVMQDLVNHLHEKRDEAQEQYQSADAPSREEGLALGKYRAYVHILEYLVDSGVEI